LEAISDMRETKNGSYAAHGTHLGKDDVAGTPEGISCGRCFLA
jgi:hypothetical protein